ncbi:class E sortase [Labedella endophytica]|uniref:Class E sortase n=1 Tax=Labedella endophytica TaxID=1523160 RepID=A0A3S0X4K7_9MICO|nr:class E sortase [Labedella endophytica]RUQ98045.1 class E sortase [Labedella endophytica]
MATTGERRSARRDRTKKRRRITFLGVFGELSITAGALIFLFLFWQLWFNDIVVRAEQNSAAESLSESFIEAAQEGPATEPTEPADPAAPPIGQTAGDAERFGVLTIPRFGDDYQAEIAGGITRARTLNTIGIGHYLTTQAPGEVGNFAVAGHRTTYGKPLNQIANLRVGDAIVVQTAEGWYTYRFRTLEYVTPSAADVLNPVPQADGVEATDRLITLTSCSPMYSAAERIIAYGVFESFTPITDPAPASLELPEGDG